MVAQEQPDSDEDHRGHDQRDGDLADVGRAEVAEGGRQVERGLSLDDPVLDAREQDRHAQCHDEPVQSALDDEQPVEDADRGTDGEHDEDAQVGVELAAVAERCRRHQQPGGDHRGQAVGRLQREVHPGDEQDEGLAHGDDSEGGDLLADTRDVRDGEERPALEQRAHDDEHREHGYQRRLADQRDGHRAPAASLPLEQGLDRGPAGRGAGRRLAGSGVLGYARAGPGPRSRSGIPCFAHVPGS